MGKEKRQKNKVSPPQPKRNVQRQEPESKSTILSQNYGVKIYDLEGKKSLEEIIKNSKVKAKYNEEAKNFTQLIEHFEFPIATTQLALCGDQRHLWCSGIYPPQIHCYELDQLTLKFNRHIESEVIKMVPLSNDFRKVVLMGHDRNLEIHAGFGSYDHFKIPKQGRDMLFHQGCAELMMVGSGTSMYRFDFEVGMFKKPYDTVTEADAINSIKMNAYHELIALGCDNGNVECIDHRARRHVGILKAAENIEIDFSVDSGMEITALQFDRDGTNLAVGTAKGQVALFDLRKERPYMLKDHHYEEAIRKIEFHDISKHVLSSDAKVLRIWDKSTGETYTNLEPPAHINDFLVFPKSGMIFVAGERSKIKPYYIPSLGHAPKWCSFVDNITEELEEMKKFSVYQDFKFVTLDELEELGLEELIGTDLLRPYMHGFFMKINLYQKAIKVHEKIQKVEKKKNREVKTEYLEKEENKGDEKVDDRFKEMLSNPDFEEIRDEFD